MVPIAVQGATGVSGSAWGALTQVGSGAKGGAPEAPFSSLMSEAISDVNGLQQQATDAVQGLMTGSGVDVHQATIATEKASLAFDMALSVRNKAVQAYQQVMSMQF